MSNDAVPAEERLEDETEMTVAAAAEVASEQDNAAPDFADDNADDESGDTADEAGEDDAEAAFAGARSEEHTSELQSLMRISYAVFCLKKKHRHNTTHISNIHTLH